MLDGPIRPMPKGDGGGLAVDRRPQHDHIGGVALRGGQGGVSNGQDIYFRVAFKPVATLLRPQETVDTEGHALTYTAQGRHDPCVLPRAVPVVEAMAAMVLVDSFLLNKTIKV
jgi:chorismate synthase